MAGWYAEKSNTDRKGGIMADQVHASQCVYPSHWETPKDSYSHHAHGMSYIQYTAVAAMQGVLANPQHADLTAKATADKASEYAAALADSLEARGWLDRSR